MNNLASKILMVSLLATVVVCGGCRSMIDQPIVNPQGQIELGNPLTVAQIDRWQLMEQISDELDNYFRIYREERIRLVDSVLTEGWIETHPKIGGTLLEPWHDDSTPGFERLHATLQTVRRFAKVRVIPTANSYLIDVKVYKELEDLPQPQHASVSSRPLRHDNSLDIDSEEIRDVVNATRIEPQNKGWIPMGRDLSLEQLILRNINERIRGICADNGPPPHG